MDERKLPGGRGGGRNTTNLRTMLFDLDNVIVIIKLRYKYSEREREPFTQSRVIIFGSSVDLFSKSWNRFGF